MKHSQESNDSSQVDKRRSRRAVVAEKVTLLVVLLGLVTAGGFAGSVWWMIDLMAHARVAYALTALLLLVILLALRSWRAAVVAAAVLAANVAVIVPMYRSAAMPNVRTAIRLVHFNVYTGNQSYQQTIDYLRSTKSDLILLEEVNGVWLAALESEPTWRVTAARGREDNFGIALIMPTDRPHDVEVVNSVIFDPTKGLAAVPAIEVSLKVGGRDAKLLYVHTLPPVSSGYAQTRDAQMAAVARWVSAQKSPAIVMGDLNATPWCAPFRRLMKETGMVDSQQSRGPQGSWPANMPWALRIPVDHCLHSDGFVTRLREVGPALGSDHRSVVVELGLR